MWSIPIRKFSAATRSAPNPPAKRRRRFGEGGQGVLEYLLVLAVVIGIFLLASRTFMPGFKKKFQSVFKTGMFAEDSTGSKFYYFPVR